MFGGGFWGIKKAGIEMGGKYGMRRYGWKDKCERRFGGGRRDGKCQGWEIGKEVNVWRG